VKIAIIRERAPGEARVAATPETVKKFTALGAELAVESGAGDAASVSDADFEAAGASVGPSQQVLAGANAILCINGPDPASLKGAEKGAMLIGALDPLRQPELINAYAKAGLEALAMEWMAEECRHRGAGLRGQVIDALKRFRAHDTRSACRRAFRDAHPGKPAR